MNLQVTERTPNQHRSLDKNKQRILGEQYFRDGVTEASRK